MEDKASPSRKRRRRRGKVPLPSFAPVRPCTEEDGEAVAVSVSARVRESAGGQGTSRIVRSLPYHRRQQQQQQQQQQQHPQLLVEPLSTLTRRELLRLQQEESPLKVETPPTQPSDSPQDNGSSRHCHASSSHHRNSLNNNHSHNNALAPGDLFTQQPQHHQPLQLVVSRKEDDTKASNTSVLQTQAPVWSSAAENPQNKAMSQSCRDESLVLRNGWTPATTIRAHPMACTTDPLVADATATATVSNETEDATSVTNTKNHTATNTTTNPTDEPPGSRTTRCVVKAPPPTTSKGCTTFRLFFVLRGHDMHEAVLAGPKRNARQRGAVVLERFDRHDDPSTFPTHFVIGSIQSRESVVRVLGFHTLLELQRFLYDHGIWCVSRSWAVQTSTEAYAPPRPGRPGQPGDLYARILPLAPPKLKRTQPAAHFSSRNSDANLMAKSAAAAVPKRNTDLAAVFTQLSKAYQKAPLDPIDSWRSYTFNIAAGRLQALPFDVTSSSLTRLSSIKGFGSSVLAIVEEYVQQQQDDDEEDEEDVEEGTANENARRRPTIGRLQEIQTNPQRQVLREFMRIWGVGRVKALELIKAGYTTIAEIRNDYCTNQLRVSLERNQYIGLLCYEDLLEKMSSEEVERIGAIVQEAVQERFAQASVTIMGSYRRNKGSYGDVDILITHPAHDKNVPPKALGRIIDQLRAANHIAYHLTQLAGMDTDAYETLPADAVRALQLSPVTAKRGKDTSSSYMGVFFSPMVAGKMRRVDIKFYPYSERIFASLYFTGNGHFNRSMRLWATRKHGYKLSDHGLFMRGVDNVRVLEPSNEAQVFYRLGLVYKEPHERDGFDAVLGEDSRRFFDLETWTSDEFRHEEHGHAWID